MAKKLKELEYKPVEVSPKKKKTKKQKKLTVHVLDSHRFWCHYPVLTYLSCFNHRYRRTT